MEEKRLRKLVSKCKCATVAAAFRDNSRCGPSPPRYRYSYTIDSRLQGIVLTPSHSLPPRGVLDLHTHVSWTGHIMLRPLPTARIAYAAAAAESLLLSATSPVTL